MNVSRTRYASSGVRAGEDDEHADGNQVERHPHADADERQQDDDQEVERPRPSVSAELESVRVAEPRHRSAAAAHRRSPTPTRNVSAKASGVPDRTRSLSLREADASEQLAEGVRLAENRISQSDERVADGLQDGRPPERLFEAAVDELVIQVALGEPRAAG